MSNSILARARLTRREVMWLSSLPAVAAIGGCAVDPVTGSRTLVGLSEAQEVNIDQQQSPHQFSADYGSVQDRALNQYITEIGNNLAINSHRPKMPYSFRVVNAAYVNAYAFPGGSIAATRGIMTELDNEAELAGLLGHEIGHVNARHAAERQGKNMLAGLGIAVLAGVVSQTAEEYAPLAAGLGSIGAGALLSKYSRDNEREADALGMEYMAKTGYAPQGMVGLMGVLIEQSKHQPSAIEMMFSSHPMSAERYKTAEKHAAKQYAAAKNQPLHKERYMDMTAGLRTIKPGLKSLQDGEKHMRSKKFADAETSFAESLKIMPNDYAANVMMAKCQLALDKPEKANHFAGKAAAIYPDEAQAQHLVGVISIDQGKYEQAFSAFDRYEKQLPGNPNTVFLKGVSMDKANNIDIAAKEYKRFLGITQQGEQAQYAYNRLSEWGLTGQ